MTGHSSPIDAAFIERIKQVVLERYGDYASFEAAMNLMPGFMENEVLTGVLPKTLIADQIVKVLHCDREWLLTGVGEAFKRKAPKAPPTPETLPPGALPASASTSSTSISTPKPPPATAVAASPNKATAGTSATLNDDPFSGAISTSPTPAAAAAAASPPAAVDEFSMVVKSAEASAAAVAKPIIANDGWNDNFSASASASASADSGFPASFISGSASSSLDMQITPGNSGSDDDSVSVKIGAVNPDGDAERAERHAMEKLQKLLPEPPTDIPAIEFAVFTQPGRRVSSEFYDFIRLGDDRLAIVVGDIAGDDGFQVWGDTSMAIKSLRIYARKSGGPRDVLIKTNTELVPDLMAESNLTVFYSELNTHTYELKMAQSGHQPALLYNPARPVPSTQLKPSGMVLGLIQGQKFDDKLEEDTLQLQSGDLLCWYTEGLPLTENSKGQDIGIDGLQLLMQSASGRTAAEFVRFILRRAESWRAGLPQKADITIVAMKVGTIPPPPPGY